MERLLLMAKTFPGISSDFPGMPGDSPSLLLPSALWGGGRIPRFLLDYSFPASFCRWSSFGCPRRSPGNDGWPCQGNQTSRLPRPGSGIPVLEQREKRDLHPHLIPEGEKGSEGMKRAGKGRRRGEIIRGGSGKEFLGFGGKELQASSGLAVLEL